MLELAQVTAVNARARTVDLVCMNTHKRPAGVLLSYASSHPEHAGGDDTLPEVGAYCYVAFPGDTSPPFVLCFVNKPDFGVDGVQELNYSENKVAMDPGDRRLSTADGNQLVLRRGGLVELSSNSLSKLMLIPVDNLIRLYAQRFQLRSPLGEIDWGHATLSADGTIVQEAIKNTPVLVRYGIKNYAQENVREHYTIEVRAGAVDKSALTPESLVHSFAHLHAQQDEQTHSPTTGDGVISIGVFDHASERKAVFVFQVRATGDVYWYSNANIHVAADKVFITANELRTITSGSTSLTALEVQLGSDELTNKGVARIDDTVRLTLNNAEVSALIAAMAQIAANPLAPITPVIIDGIILDGSTVVFAK